jgi:hypothetical protein
MEIKKNINKIHFELSDRFSDVSISEKSEKRFGNHIELTINESDMILKAIISKKDLENDNFSWSYFSNPENEDSLVERFSSVTGFIDDVNDIFEKKRFDSDYLKNKI